MQGELGITFHRQYWMPRDYSRKRLATRGKLRGPWRCHDALGEMLQLHLQSQHEHVGAYFCLLSQALRQTAIDNGDWSNASLTLPTEDPLSRTPFGADERLLAEIYSYRKAIRELNVKGYHTGKGEESDAENGGPRPDKAKGGGKNREEKKK